MAAGSFLKLTATPYSLQYIYTGGGSADSLTAATLIADCAAGPLKTFLTQANAYGTWISAAFSKVIRVYGTQETGAAANITSVLFTTGGSNGLQVASAGVCTALIEIVFKHSIDR